MSLTADTITAEQIRAVVWDLYKSAPGVAAFIRNAMCDLTDKALRGDISARARCAEILNARTKEADHA